MAMKNMIHKSLKICAALNKLKEILTNVNNLNGTACEFLYSTGDSTDI